MDVDNSKRKSLKRYKEAVRAVIANGRYQSLCQLLDSDEGKMYGVNFKYTFYIPEQKGKEYNIDSDEENLKYQYYGTPLFHAVLLEMERHTRIKTIELLLERGANIFYRCYHYRYVPAYMYVSDYKDDDEYIWLKFPMSRLDKLVFSESVRHYYGIYYSRIDRLINIFAPYVGFLPCTGMYKDDL